MKASTERESLGLISALIVDDNAFDRRRLSRTADATGLEFFLKEVSTVQEFGHVLDQEKFDIIYVDLNLAGEDGMKLLPGVREHHVNRDAAMIMVAGSNQAEIALQAVRAGFADYIEKDALTPASLERATVNAIQKLRLTRAATSAEADTKMIETVLKSFADACSGQMRPMMTRMVRQVRQIKSEAESLGIQSRNLAEIEQTCARMDEFFQDLGALASSRQLSTVIDFAGRSLSSDKVEKPPLAPTGSDVIVPKRPNQARQRKGLLRL